MIYIDRDQPRKEVVYSNKFKCAGCHSEFNDGIEAQIQNVDAERQAADDARRAAEAENRSKKEEKTKTKETATITIKA